MTTSATTVMISSTARDLAEHRQVVMRVGISLGLHPVLMENMPASPRDALTEALRLVDEAEVYVGIFGYRYGYIPDDPRNPERLSITELEYRRAIQRGIPILIFLMHKDQPITAGMVETGEGAIKLQQLKNRLQNTHVVSYFRSPDDLRAHVEHAFTQLRREISPASRPGRGDDVAFTHFYPSTIADFRELPLHVYIHLASALEQVKQDFERRRSFAITAHTASQPSNLPFVRGTLFTIIPFVENARTKPRLVEVIWEDDIEHIQFVVVPNQNIQTGGVLQGEVRIYVGPLVVGTLPIDILSEQAETERNFCHQTKFRYKKLFASYSRDDLAVIQALDHIYEKHPEIEFFVDYKFLRSGDYWWNEIKKKIEEAEAIQLFWSPSSAQSTNVKKEWEYGLNLPRPILPVIFGRPKPEIPSALAHIHFEDFERFIMGL